MDRPHENVDDEKAHPSNLISGNIGLLSTLALFLIVVVKVLAVSHFSATTALAIASSASTTEVIFGSLLVSAAAVISLLYALLLYVDALDLTAPQDKGIIRMGLIVILFIVIAILPWSVVLFYAVGLLIVFEGPSRSMYRFIDVLARKGWLGRRAKDRVSYFEVTERRIAERHDRFQILAKRGEEAAKRRQQLAEEAKLANDVAERKREAYLTARGLRRRRAKRAYEDAALQAKSKLTLIEQEVAVQKESLGALEAIQAETKSSLEDSKRRLERSRSTLHRLKAGALLYIFVLGVATFLALVNDRPWMPAKRITLDGGTRIVAYVLDADSGALTVLRDDDRRVIMLPPHLVARQTICEGEAGPNRVPTAIEAIFGRSKEPGYPKCS